MNPTDNNPVDPNAQAMPAADSTPGSAINDQMAGGAATAAPAGQDPVMAQPAGMAPAATPMATDPAPMATEPAMTTETPAVENLTGGMASPVVPTEEAGNQAA